MSDMSYRGQFSGIHWNFVTLQCELKTDYEFRHFSNKKRTNFAIHLATSSAPGLIFSDDVGSFFFHPFPLGKQCHIFLSDGVQHSRGKGLAPGPTIGGYTSIMNMIFVGLQWLILRDRFEKVQLFQLLLGFIFGALIDANMYLTSFIDYSAIHTQILAQFMGCTIMAAGISAEIRYGSLTMPGEGIQVAISKVSGLNFAKVKIIIDTSLVVLAVISCYIFFGRWLWDVIGPGTLFAMVYVGYMVKLFSPRMGWFNRLLRNGSNIPRYIYGLALYLSPEMTVSIGKTTCQIICVTLRYD